MTVVMVNGSLLQRVREGLAAKERARAEAAKQALATGPDNTDHTPEWRRLRGYIPVPDGYTVTPTLLATKASARPISPVSPDSNEHRPAFSPTR